jgi:predicted nucleotide-binding protein
MKERRFRNSDVPASHIGKLREYLATRLSRSLGEPWGHRDVSYELWYADGPVRCSRFDDVVKVIGSRGETSRHVTSFESLTGRKLKFDTTDPSAIVVGVENGRLTDAMLKRVMEIMSLSPHPRQVFVTHGQGSDWREVTHFIEKECSPGLPTLELASRPHMGRTLIEKLDTESAHCSYAVIVMTGDDILGDEVRARENVMHEIGFFQGRYGRPRVCLLHEDGVGIPSNLLGVGYSPFPKGQISKAFIELMRELRVAFPAVE